MNITGALVERVLQQPVDDIDHVLVIGIQLAGAPQLHQLFQVLDIAGRRVAGGLRADDRARYRVELEQVAADVFRVRDDDTEFLAMNPAQLLHPFPVVGLCRRDGNRGVIDPDRQHVEPGRVGIGHDFRHGFYVDLQRIDTLVRQSDPAGQPFAQHRQGQQLGMLGMLPVAFRNNLQGMLFAVVGADRDRAQHVRAFRIDQAVLLHPGQDLMQVELAMLLIVHHCIHRERCVSSSDLVRQSAVRRTWPVYSTIPGLFLLY